MSNSFRDVSFELDGRRLEAVWWGPGPDMAPTLVLLHEGLGCVALWRDMPARLAAAIGCGVFAWSRFGYGQSAPVGLPRPLTYMHEEAREVLPRVLDAVGIRRAILIGHSDGASIAALYAGERHDPRLRGLVLIAPHFFVEDETIAGIAAARDAYLAGDLRRRLARYHVDVDGAFWGWNRAWLDPGFRAWRIDAAVPGITVPVLLVQGTADEYGTEAQLRLAEAKLGGPVRTVLIDGAGHSPHLARPDEVVREIKAFCAEAAL